MFDLVLGSVTLQNQDHGCNKRLEGDEENSLQEYTGRGKTHLSRVIYHFERDFVEPSE